MKGESGIRKMRPQRKRILIIPPTPSFNNAPNSESINGPNYNHATQNKSSEQPKTPINRRISSHLFWHHKLPRSPPQNSNKQNQATLQKMPKRNSSSQHSTQQQRPKLFSLTTTLQRCPKQKNVNFLKKETNKSWIYSRG